MLKDRSDCIVHNKRIIFLIQKPKINLDNFFVARKKVNFHTQNVFKLF